MDSMKQLSSGSDVDPRYVGVDEKKRKRMISNRESARRSRMKKQQHSDTLLSEITQIQAQNKQLDDQINVVAANYFQFESENRVLKAQYDELTDRLRSLNSFLEIVGEVSGHAVDIHEMPQILLEPWQLPCQVQHTSSMFQC
ncbi:bZIP transcription factor 53 [Impatiens glandulifera]|uniref:bZIP transcription factor 53 n=1 Tax=Impatiens glandulifera TaxID=253017 RepID=UPI001FB0B5E3|nr:bZIP transcription factor 53 [Impatiens glandulifera]